MRLKSHPEIVWWCYLQEDSGSVKFRTQSWRGRASDDLGFYFFCKFFPSPPFWISTSVLETSNHETLKVKTVFLDSGKIQTAFDLGSRLPSKAALTHSRLQGYNFFFALCNFCYIYSKLDTLALEALEGIFFPLLQFREAYQDLIQLGTVNPLSKRAARFLRVLNTDFPIPFLSCSTCLRTKVYFPPANPLQAAFCQVSELILWMMSL